MRVARPPRDDVLIRGLMLIPMMFAFSQSIIVAYLLFVTIHATWAHTNFGPSISGWSLT
jgi:hypothetical protein